MDKVAVLIETKNGEIKKTNFGVIAAARGDGHEIYAFLLDAGGSDCKNALAAHGVHKIVEIASEEGLFEWNPVVWAKAVISAMKHYSIKNVVGWRYRKSGQRMPGDSPRITNSQRFRNSQRNDGATGRSYYWH